MRFCILRNFGLLPRLPFMNSHSSPDGVLMESSGEQAIGSLAISCHKTIQREGSGHEDPPRKRFHPWIEQCQSEEVDRGQRRARGVERMGEAIYNSNLPHLVQRLGLRRSRRGGTRNIYTRSPARLLPWAHSVTEAPAEPTQCSFFDASRMFWNCFSQQYSCSHSQS